MNRDTYSSGCICSAVYNPVLQLSVFLSHVIRLGEHGIEFRLRNDDLFEDLTADHKKHHLVVLESSPGDSDSEARIDQGLTGGGISFHYNQALNNLKELDWMSELDIGLRSPR